MAVLKKANQIKKLEQRMKFYESNPEILRKLTGKLAEMNGKKKKK